MQVNALWLALLSLVGFGVAYFVYGRFLSEKIFALDPQQLTPSHEFEDGVDYVPSNRYVLFGHHFASIAGLGPILGPAIAVIWGWLPALLWVTLGTIFFGAVHDLSALCVSLKHQGRSISDVTGDIIGPRSRLLFQIIIFFLLALAMGVFALTIAQLFTHKGVDWTPETQMYPEAIIPTIVLMVVAMGMGVAVYKRRMPLGPVTMVGIALMAVGLWVGISNPFTGLGRDTWVYILLGYAFLASVLPVWLLLQPRDYLNSFQLYAGLILLFGGLIVLRPDVVAPAINTADTGAPPAYPFLFITIACGAISGFHNLVSSGTTARQIDKPTDATFIGYGGMIAEGVLAVGVIMACVAGIGSTGEWNAHYGSWSSAAAGGLKGFITGGARLVAGLGVPREWGAVFIATVAVSFAMTTLDSATRLLRYNIEELAKTLKVAPLQNPFAASLLAVVAIGFFALLKVDGRPAGIILWTLFGTTNQVLAMLGLLVVTVWLWRTGRPIMFTVIPMVYMTVTCSYAMLISLKGFVDKGQTPLIIVGGLVFVLAIWMVIEGVLVFFRMRGERAAAIAARSGIAAETAPAWRRRP